MPPGPALSRRTLLTGSLGVVGALAAGCSPARTSGSPAGTAGSAPPPAGSAAPTGSPASGSPAQPTGSPAPLAEPAPGASPAASGRPGTTDSAAVAARAIVPVLCWHQLRDWRPTDADYTRRLLVCPPQRFRAQLDALAEDGWNSISPDQYLAHLTTGAALPRKPVLLSFDDSQGTQISEGLPQLRRRDMTGTFFCMTVVLDKPDWMSRADLRRLADAGMTVAAHTYDHHRADRYSGPDWALQFEQPRELLEKVVRRPVEHFAYPYGAWAPRDFPHLRAAGYRTAFQLSDEPLERAEPRYTLRRILVDSTWTGAELLRQVRRRP